MAGRNIKRKKYTGSISQKESLKFTDHFGNEYDIDFDSSQSQDVEIDIPLQLSDELQSGIPTEDNVDDVYFFPTSDLITNQDKEREGSDPIGGQVNGMLISTIFILIIYCDAWR